MLVLSRKKGESIVIQDQIEITILEIGSETVKIGIEAPADVEILRKELVVSVKDSNVESAQKPEHIQEMAKQFKNIQKKLPRV